MRTIEQRYRFEFLSAHYFEKRGEIEFRYIDKEDDEKEENEDGIIYTISEDEFINFLQRRKHEYLDFTEDYLDFHKQDIIAYGYQYSIWDYMDEMHPCDHWEMATEAYFNDFIKPTLCK